MNLVMMLAFLVTAQNPANVKALDFNLIGSNVVQMAPMTPPPGAKRPNMQVKPIPRPSAQEDDPGTLRVHVKDEGSVKKDVKPVWLQSSDGSYYRLERSPDGSYYKVIRKDVEPVTPTQPAPQQWFQNPDGSYYKVVRRYVMPAPQSTQRYTVPSTQGYSVPYSTGGGWGATGGSCGPMGGPTGFSPGGT